MWVQTSDKESISEEGKGRISTVLQDIKSYLDGFLYQNLITRSVM